MNATATPAWALDHANAAITYRGKRVLAALRHYDETGSRVLTRGEQPALVDGLHSRVIDALNMTEPQPKASPVTTTPAPATLSARLATAQAQLAGALEAGAELSASDLCSLAAFLNTASADAARLEAPRKVVIEVQDGLVQTVSADGPCIYVKLDYDTEGADPEDLARVPLEDGDTAKAFFSYPDDAQSDARAQAWVARIHDFDPDADTPADREPDRDTDHMGNTAPGA